MPKILLIDDDVLLSKVVQSMLETEGFQVISQENSRYLTEVIQTESPKLIILDYFFPQENGADIATRLKNQSQTKQIPIIMVSSSYGVESIAKNIGVEAFLPKPFDVDKLVTLIKKLAP